AHLGANGQRFYHYLDLAATDVGCLSLSAASDRRYCVVDRDRYRRWVAGGFVPLVAPVDGTDHGVLPRHPTNRVDPGVHVADWHRRRYENRRHYFGCGVANLAEHH